MPKLLEDARWVYKTAGLEVGEGKRDRPDGPGEATYRKMHAENPDKFLSRLEKMEAEYKARMDAKRSERKKVEDAAEAKAEHVPCEAEVNVVALLKKLQEGFR